jgi:hypothetical protein
MPLAELHGINIIAVSESKAAAGFGFTANQERAILG